MRTRSRRWHRLLAIVPLVLTVAPSLASNSEARPAATALTTLVDDELSNLASRIDCCLGKNVKSQPGERKRWQWDAEKEEWRISSYRGFAIGVIRHNGDIWIWPKAHDYDKDKPLSEQPGFLAEALRTLAHECLHFKCPPHNGPPEGVSIPGGEPDPKKPPTGEGQDPDCNEINYAIHTAKAVCDEICAVKACAEDPECGELRGRKVNGDGDIVDADPIPGTDTPAGRCAYCKALRAAYEDIQKRWNTEKNAKTAKTCACGPPPPGWEPEDEERDAFDDFSDCPDFPDPPGGCDGEPPYPDNKVIPDCPCDCPTEGCEDH